MMTAPMLIEVSELTQLDTCIIDSSTSLGDFYASLFNETRTVALMITEKEGALNARIESPLFLGDH